MDDQDVFDEETEVEESTEESEKGVEAPVEQTAKAEESTEAEEEPPSSEDSKTVPMSALIAERRRRQEAEEKLQSKEKAPDPVTDPDGYQEYQDAKSLTDKINLTADFAKDLYEDYSEKEKVFMELVSSKNDDGSVRITDEGLYKKFLQAPNPAKFAYQTAKKHLSDMEKLSDEYETNIRRKHLQELKEQGLLNVDAADLPDFTNAADVQSNNSLQSEGDPDRIDVFDE